MPTPSTALTSISWTDRALLDEAKREAAELGLNFSVYITQIVRQHLRSPEPLDILRSARPRGSPYPEPRSEAAMVAEKPGEVGPAEKKLIEYAKKEVRKPRILRHTKL